MRSTPLAQRYRPPVISIVDLTASAVCPTPSASFVLDLGTPSQGTFWEVRRIVTGGLDVTTLADGSAGLYLSGSPTVNGAGLNNAEDWAPFLPSIKRYGPGALYVRSSEHVFLVVSGATAGQTYVSHALCRVYTTASQPDWIS